MRKILDEKFYEYYDLAENSFGELRLINKKEDDIEVYNMPINNTKITLYVGEEEREVSYKDIYQEFFSWDNETIYFKTKYQGLDLRTAKYLDAVILNTGLINKEVDYDEENFITKEEIKVWVNLNEVSIGKVKNGLWCAQWVEAGNDDYSIIKLYFNKKPSVNTLQTLDLVEKIMFLGDIHCLNTEFRCVECGRKFHWLDIEGSIFRKYEALEDKLCGDEISK